MGKTIVLVDDNDELLEACVAILIGEGYEVAAFTKVEDAKTFLCGTKNITSIHAIVSDLIMGPVGGLEFLAFVKTNPNLKHIDFYILTGTILELFEPYYSCYTIKGVIEKPCTPKNLLAKISDKNPDRLVA